MAPRAFEILLIYLLKRVHYPWNSTLSNQINLQPSQKSYCSQGKLPTTVCCTQLFDVLANTINILCYYDQIVDKGRI